VNDYILQYGWENVLGGTDAKKSRF
jgi:hypothetical protein